MDEGVISPSIRAWAARSIGRISKSVPPLGSRQRRRLLVIHLDGLPRALLDSAIRTGRMPFLSSLARSRAYRLDSAFWGSPASTPAFQAGLLFGLRHPNLPAYHWFDRELGRVVRMNVPPDTCAIEERLTAAASGSLLEGGGTSYLSLFQAGASNRLAMSSLAHTRLAARSLARELKGLSGAKRQGGLRYLKRVAGDAWSSSIDSLRWVDRLRDARHEREFVMNQFFMISLAWNLAHSRALVDMVRGVPAIYLVFGNYDEVAHRRGPLSEQATRELYRVDAQLEELYAVARSLEQPYDVYLLTDHGHVGSAPLEQRIGRRLERALLEGGAPPLSEAVERGLLDGRRFVPDSPVQHREEPVVIEAGNFAHVYLTRGPEPLEAMALLRSHRDVLARAISERDIGIVAVRRKDSAAAIVGRGVFGPDDVHRAPLSSEFSRSALADLLRELPHMRTAGDLVLFGEVCQPGGTVGFAWEFGSHGGLTRTETDSFLLWPGDVPLDLAGLSHVTQLHEKLSELYRG